jgi:hypothetical protein
MEMLLNKRRLGVLYQHMRPERWWWECFEITRRLTVSLAISFVFPGTPLQIIALFGIITIYLVACCLIRPYKQGTINDFAINTQLALAIVLLVGMAVQLRIPLLSREYNKHNESNAVSVLVLLLMGATAVHAIMVVLSDVNQRRKAWLAIRNTSSYVGLYDSHDVACVTNRRSELYSGAHHLFTGRAVCLDDDHRKLLAEHSDNVSLKDVIGDKPNALSEAEVRVI